MSNSDVVAALETTLRDDVFGNYIDTLGQHIRVLGQTDRVEGQFQQFDESVDDLVNELGPLVQALEQTQTVGGTGSQQLMAIQMAADQLYNTPLNQQALQQLVQSAQQAQQGQQQDQGQQQGADQGQGATQPGYQFGSGNPSYDAYVLYQQLAAEGTGPAMQQRVQELETFGYDKNIIDLVRQYGTQMGWQPIQAGSPQYNQQAQNDPRLTQSSSDVEHVRRLIKLAEKADRTDLELANKIDARILELVKEG